ncbi:MAG: hypothetical protein IPK79_09280 [Vampirovibrionales bacterium]|nr:hypothetical protein [Vampirovibrionales bacterium]
MPVTIQFDTLKDLEKFMSGRDISVSTTTKRGPGRKKANADKAPAAKAPGRRGRPPKAAAASKMAAPAKRGRKAKAAATVEAPKKRGPKPKASAAPKTNAGKGRPRGSDSLTSKIQGAIQKFIDQKQAFTANDVYAEVARRNRDVNKQSVITSVLKQMKSTYQNISVSERPGAGPRPVKVYQA